MSFKRTVPLTMGVVCLYSGDVGSPEYGAHARTMLLWLSRLFNVYQILDNATEDFSHRDRAKITEELRHDAYYRKKVLSMPSSRLSVCSKDEGAETTVLDI